MVQEKRMKDFNTNIYSDASFMEEAEAHASAEKARQADPYGKNEERTLTEEEKARLPPPVVTASQRDRPGA